MIKISYSGLDSFDDSEYDYTPNDIRKAFGLKPVDAVLPTTIYYAHSQWKYDTKIERYELELINRYFPHGRIFDPSLSVKTVGRSEKEIMTDCINAVLDSDVLIFSGLDGMVGKGVYQEIAAAKDAGKLILYIYQDRLTTEFKIYEIPEYGTDRLYARVDI